MNDKEFKKLKMDVEVALEFRIFNGRIVNSRTYRDLGISLAEFKKFGEELHKSCETLMLIMQSKGWHEYY